MSWFDWVDADLIQKALKTGVTLYGQQTKTDANKKALQQVTDATNAQIAAQKAGYDQAIGMLEKNVLNNQYIQGQTAPGLNQQQLAIAQQNTLTPAQQAALDDARKRAVETIASSGLRGSGRATSAIVRDVEGRIKSGYMDANRARADQAASNLASQYFTAGRDTNAQNTNIANTYSNIGNATARGIGDIGQNQAAATTSNANIYANTAADIAGTGTTTRAINDINNQMLRDEKDEYTKRQTSYKNPVYL